MARGLRATVRPCLAAGAAIAAVVALLQFTGDRAETDLHAADPQAVTDETVSLRTARETGKAVRVASLTSETTEVYALPDGQLRADISAGLQRFRRDGGWVTVDQTLRAARDGSVTAAAHPGDLWMSGPRGEGEHDLAAVGLGDDRVTMRWTGALPTPIVDGTRARYVNARPGVDLVVESTRRGFEQYLIVKDRAAADRVADVTWPRRTTP